jgi:endo-1,4-beta-xylanase
MLFLIPAMLCVAMPAKIDDPKTLREAAAKRRLLFGTAIAAQWLTAEPIYATTAGQEFSQAEPENEMKFGSLHPRPDTDPNPYDFKGADAIVAFAEAHKMKVRGHCFVWHNQVARWVTTSNFTPEQLSTTLHSHIDTVAKHFKGKVYAWDVVNEAFNDDGSLRHTVWYDRPGIGMATQNTAYIEQAFRWAHEADRRAKLYYNDYSDETINRKSDGIYAMLKDFKKRRVPVDGVGFQMHVDLRANNPTTLESIKKNFQRFADLGLDIQITELDISLSDNTPESLTKEADLYRAITQICLDQRRCKAIQIWGFTDKHSWISQFNRNRGWALLFDDKYMPKPAYTAVLEALNAKR